jgi:hypothetical protein
MLEENTDFLGIINQIGAIIFMDVFVHRRLVSYVYHHRGWFIAGKGVSRTTIGIALSTKHIALLISSP